MSTLRFLNDHIPAFSRPHPYDGKGHLYVFEFPNGRTAQVESSINCIGGKKQLWQVSYAIDEADIKVKVKMGHLTDIEVSNELYGVCDMLPVGSKF